MKEVEILEEMLGIYKKYFKAVVEMGTIKMSPKDGQRLKELDMELTTVRTLKRGLDDVVQGKVSKIDLNKL